MEYDDKALINLSRNMGGAGPAKVLIENLAKHDKFKKAIETSAGQELVKDVLNEMSKKLELMYEEKATPKDLADFRAYKKILGKWTTILNKYERDFETFIKKSN